MAHISPEKTGYYPPVEAKHKFSVSYPGDVVKDHQPPFPRFTDPGYLKLKEIEEKEKRKPPNKYSKIIPPSEYSPEIVGELINRWQGQGKVQEIEYLDKNGDFLYFDASSFDKSDVEAKLKISQIVRRLKYYQTETQDDVTFIHRDETVAEVRTFMRDVSEINKRSTIPQAANSKPLLIATGRTPSELEEHLWFLKGFLALSAEAQKKNTERHTPFSIVNAASDPEYTIAVDQLFEKARIAVEERIEVRELPKPE